MKTLAVSQSNYIPWKGYFDIINKADEFILYDDMQYTKNDWRNRNMIKTSSGPQWLTIPVRQENLHQTINQTQTTNSRWQSKHWKSIQHNYHKAPYFKDYAPLFEELYARTDETFLSRINYNFLMTVIRILGIQTKISWSSDYTLTGERVERLINLCRQTGSDTYLSSPAGKNYINVQDFHDQNIEILWMEYSGYPEYNQFYPPFTHQVSILDLIFHTGPDAAKHMISF